MLNDYALFCALYVNELLMRLLNRYEAYPNLFSAYEEVIENIQDQTPDYTEGVLRLFERRLLDALGYGINFIYDYKGDDILASRQYTFAHEQGFMPIQTNTEIKKSVLVCDGQSLLEIADNNFQSLKTKQIAKQLMRTILAYYLGGKPLYSRQLFQRHEGAM
jgi:DNA repair protein RecO (recombination protein O)